MEKQFFIERTNENHSFEVVSRHNTYDNALETLNKIDSTLRHELWCYDWVNTHLGYAPMAWIN